MKTLNFCRFYFFKTNFISPQTQYNQKNYRFRINSTIKFTLCRPPNRAEQDPRRPAARQSGTPSDKLRGCRSLRIGRSCAQGGRNAYHKVKFTRPPPNSASGVPKCFFTVCGAELREVFRNRRFLNVFFWFVFCHATENEHSRKNIK